MTNDGESRTFKCSLKYYYTALLLVAGVLFVLVCFFETGSHIALDSPVVGNDLELPILLLPSKVWDYTNVSPHLVWGCVCWGWRGTVSVSSVLLLWF